MLFAELCVQQTDTLRRQMWKQPWSEDDLIFYLFCVIQVYLYNKILKRQLIPECSHHISYSYSWPTVMNNIFFIYGQKSA